MTAVYNPKAFVPHAASLRQGFPHCERFSTAASRRSPGSVSVPMWLTTLSGQLPVIALVSFYLTNKLIGRGLLQRQQALRSPSFTSMSEDIVVILGISPPFSRLSQFFGQITHVLLTLSPLTVRKS